MVPGRLPVRETINALSPKYSHNVIGSIRTIVNKGGVPVLFVLDDDPTGTQTYHDIDVLTMFEANKMAAEAASQTFEIVLRGDSTLRGHLPEEPKAAEEALIHFNGLIMALVLYQGGCYAVADLHYIKENDELKCGKRLNESSFVPVTLQDIRVGGPASVAEKLLAAAESHIHIFIPGLLEAEKSGRQDPYRTGAAFVSPRPGITGIPQLTLADLGVSTKIIITRRLPGSLIMAGSRGDKLTVIELDVAQLISSPEAAEAMVKAAAQQASSEITKSCDVLAMTSRLLIKSQDALTSLSIGSQVAKALVQLVELIDARPQYFIAKGGIASLDAAAKGLRMRRAKVLGQAAPGTPLRRCDEETSRHRVVPYMVFPGSVGRDQTLADVVEAWSTDESG
ncbi:hypothetical protein BKA56DRAFT_637292 [Ilyonectria sp. MPI-CAGE-AT-0026]|nr:hypothetical protein BKA56DRAFT_637292 [Ilyonectria sp. MPI-CAGE-AT-0026]